LPGGEISQDCEPVGAEEDDQLEAAADQAIAACGGDAREAVKALIVANHFLETELDKLKSAVSTGYARGRLLEHALGPRLQFLVSANKT
jgi:hypothetical protein